MATLTQDGETSASADSGALFRFLDLPTEIRNNVYAFCALFTNTSSGMYAERVGSICLYDTDTPSVRFSTIVATCKLIRIEMIQHIFDNIVVEFMCTPNHSPYQFPLWTSRWVELQDETTIEAIRRVRFWLVDFDQYACDWDSDSSVEVDVRNGSISGIKGSTSEGSCDIHHSKRGAELAAGIKARLDGIELRGGVRYMTKAVLSDMLELVRGMNTPSQMQGPSRPNLGVSREVEIESDASSDTEYYETWSNDEHEEEFDEASIHHF